MSTEQKASNTTAPTQLLQTDNDVIPRWDFSSMMPFLQFRRSLFVDASMKWIASLS
jgi:hypothetical protein